MKKLVFLLIISVSLFAEQCQKLNDSSILTKVQDSYSKLASFKAGFSQTSFLDALDTSESSKGEVFFKKPGKMRWHYTSPEEQVFVINDKTYFLYQIEEKQVMIDNLSKVLVSEVPVAFLMGVGNLAEDFELIKSEKCGNNISLKLKSKKDSGLKELNLEVGSNYLPKTIGILDQNNNRTTISLSNYQENYNIEDSLFEEDFPRGTDISDSRGVE